MFLNSSNFAGNILAYALALSIFTNLRFQGYAFGGPEIFILLFSLYKIFTQYHNNPVLIIKAASLWIGLFLPMFIGYAYNVNEGSLVLHNAVAYCYGAVVSIGMLAYLNSLNSRERSRIFSQYSYCTLLFFFISLVLYAFLPWGSLLDLRFPDTGRFQSWCENANQAALVFAPLPFLYLACRNKISFYDYGLVFLIFFIGSIVRSDALVLAWLVACIFGFVFNFIVRRFSTHTIGYIFCLLITSLILVKLLIVSGIFDLSGEPEIGSYRIGKGDTLQKIMVRLELWTNAVTSVSSPLFGNGPGAFSSFRPSSEEHYIGMEAHNIFVDMYVQVGIVGLSVFVLTLFYIFRAALNSRSVFLLMGLISLVVFECFMFHFRQPVFLYYLIVVYLGFHTSSTTQNIHKV